MLNNRATQERSDNKAVVSGSVTLANGEAAVGVLVQIHERSLSARSRKLVEGTTDHNGEFRLEYVSATNRPHLLIRAVRPGASSRTKPLASILKTKATPDETVQLKIDDDSYRGPSQLERLRDVLDPIVADDVAESDDELLNILASEADLPPTDVRSFLRARKIARDTSQPLEVAYALSQLATEDDLSDLFAQGGRSRLDNRLQQLVNQNLVPEELVGPASGVLDDLQDRYIDQIATGNDGLGGLLETAGIRDLDSKKAIVALNLEHGTDAPFWEALKDVAGARTNIDSLKVSLEMNQLIGGNAPLVGSLRQQYHSARDLARLTTSQWAEHLAASGESNQRRIREQTAQLKRRSEEAFPSTAIARSLEEAGERPHILDFLDKHQAFDFAHTHIRSFLDRDDVSVAQDERANLANELAALQRVFRIAPTNERYESMRVLLDEDYDSAYKISRMPRDSFVTHIAPLLPGSDNEASKVNAAWIYDQAYQQTATTIGMFAYGMDYAIIPGNIRGFSNLQDFGQTNLDTSPEDQELFVRIAEYRELFGSIDFCRCDHCESVLGPAAYLVDLLNWLDRSALLNPLIAEGRRADILDIKLTCSNTDGFVPYVDLVNEILEDEVADINVVHSTPTDYSDEELVAQPIYLNPAAYELLKMQTPPNAPALDLWESYAREFLAHLDVERLEIIEAFDPPSAIQAQRDQLLGMTLQERLFAEDQSEGSYSGKWIGNRNHIVSRFLDTTGLEHSQLLDLLHARSANYVRAITIVADPSLPDDTALDECDLEQWHLRHNGGTPSREMYLRLHRFLTLWRSTDWSMLELDKAIMILRELGPGAASRTVALRHLSEVIRLMRMTGADLLPLLSLWDNIDTEPDRADADPRQRSLYEQIFQNPSLSANAIAAFDLSAAPARYIRDHRPALQAALGISAQDLRLLEIEEYGQAAEIGDADAGAEISLENLSRLYRHTVLANAVGLSIQDCLCWQRLLESDPFRVPQATVTFIKSVRNIQEAGFEAVAALYYFDHDPDAALQLSLSEAELTQLLVQLRDAIQQTSLGEPEDQESALSLREFLARLHPDTYDFDDLFSLIAGTSGKTDEEKEFLIDQHLAVFLDANQAKQNLAYDGIVEPDKRWRYVEDALRDYYLEQSLISAMQKAAIAPGAQPDVLHLAASRPHNAQQETRATNLLSNPLASALVSLEEALVKLVYGGGQLVKAVDRASYLINILLPHGERVAALEKTLATLLNTDINIMRELLLHPAQAGARGRLIDIFLARQFIDTEMNAQDQPEVFAAMRKLAKIAQLYRKLDISYDLHLWLVRSAQALDIARPWLLPVDEAQADIPNLEWRNLLDVYRLERRLPGSEPTLPEILALLDAYNASSDQAKVDALAALIEAVAVRTQRTADDLDYILKVVVGLNDPAVVLHPGDLLRLAWCCDLLRRTGASARQLYDWGDTLDAVKAFEIRESVASRFDYDQWLDVSQGIHDRLRVTQRDALITYLVNNDDRFHSSNDLYAYFLVDPEMEPCRTTSRVQLAINAIQLYVQRLFLGLEDSNVAMDQFAEEWKWRRLYRVWEANRKVFLYPENWICPELRADKTELFEILENDLQQGDLTSDNGKTALANYLTSLESLSSIEIAGMYLDGDVENLGDLSPKPTYWVPHLSDATILHMIGRKEGKPSSYYYRSWKPGIFVDYDQWTAWKHIDLEIEGHQVLPIVRWGRLFLFWYTVKEGSDEDGKTSVRVTYSELLNDVWTTPRTTEIEDVYEFFVKDQKDAWLLAQENLYGYYSSRTLEEDSLVLSLVQLSFMFEGGFPTSNFYLSRPNKTVKFFGGNEGYYQLGEGQPDYGRWIVEVDSSSNELITTVPPMVLDPEGQNWFYWPFQTIFRTDTGQGGFGYDSIHRVADAWVRGANGRPSHHAFAVADRRYSFLVSFDNLTADYANPALPEHQLNYALRRLHHPYVSQLVQAHIDEGVNGLLSPAWDPGTSRFEQLSRQQLYDPLPSWNSSVALRLRSYLRPAVDEIDFDHWRANAMYNWELFFFVPFYIANRLRDVQKFEEAMDWYHYLFEPMNNDFWDVNDYPNYPEDMHGLPVPLEYRYWKFRPFLSHPGSSVQTMLRNLGSEGDLSPIRKQIAQWLAKPFDPHAIASLRTSAYMKAVLMAYLDNLIEWGDYLFNQYRRETINEATQLYILAAEILGDRPREVLRHNDRPEYSFNDLKAHGLDDFSNLLVQLENLLPASGGAASDGVSGGDDITLADAIPSLYFCVPPNEELLEYWTKIEERLYKIRHCQDIEGLERSLPKWDPPIDPEILVRATAAGIDIDTVLADMDAPLGYYRFNVILQKAMALTASVRQLGNALQTALEKRDAEDLALLRSSLEQDMYKAVLQVRKDQLEEAQKSIAALEANKRIVEERKAHYEQLIKRGLLPQEQMQLLLLERSRGKQQDAELWETVAAAMGAIPNASGGLSGKITPFGPQAPDNWSLGASFGGSNLAAIFSAIASKSRSQARGLEYYANRMSIDAGHFRRQDEWAFQLRLAEKEIEHLDRQIATAQIREAIAAKEIDNQELQIDNARQVHDWMQRKFTHRELYNWMHGQLKSIYYQSYNLAYDMAKRAERAFRYELSITDAAPLIEYGNWDNQREGLLAGERLQAQIERLDAAYMEQDRREHDLTKHVSLALLDPLALLAFREAGKCYFSLPEVLFDLELPGHYMRRIKSVSLTIPAVTGPYTSIHATLTMQASYIRRQADSAELEFETGVAQSIVTSSGRHDAGVFQLNHQDPRYLPFERRGAISDWVLALTDVVPTFDRRTISDVIMHIEYTSRDGGEAYQQARGAAVINALNEIRRQSGPDHIAQWFDVQSSFPDLWQRFLNGQAVDGERSLTLDLTSEHLPYMFRSGNLQRYAAGQSVPANVRLGDPEVHQVGLLVSVRGAPRTSASWSLQLGAVPMDNLQLIRSDQFGSQFYGSATLGRPSDPNDANSPLADAPQPWGPLTLSLASDWVDKGELIGMSVILFYELT